MSTYSSESYVRVYFFFRIILSCFSFHYLTLMSPFFFRIVPSCPLFFLQFRTFMWTLFLQHLNFIPICSSGSNFHDHIFFRIILSYTFFLHYHTFISPLFFKIVHSCPLIIPHQKSLVLWPRLFVIPIVKGSCLWQIRAKTFLYR